MIDGFLFQALVYITAAVVCVPVARRLGMGSVLGYLIAGIVIGPSVLGFIGIHAVHPTFLTEQLKSEYYQGFLKPINA